MSTYPLHDFSKFPLYPDFPQPPTDFSASQKLDIGEIKYEAPNFVSTHATPKLLADAVFHPESFPILQGDFCMNRLPRPLFFRQHKG